MVEMDVHARHDVTLEVMLYMSQFSCQVAHVMVIDKRNRADRFFVVTPLLSNQVVPDQISQCFRSIRILALLDVLIKIIEEMMVQRHAESNKLLHDRITSGTILTNVAFQERRNQYLLTPLDQGTPQLESMAATGGAGVNAACVSHPLAPRMVRGGQVPPQTARVQRALSECARCASTEVGLATPRNFYSF